jgi:hypothetical protein
MTCSVIIVKNIFFFSQKTNYEETVASKLLLFYYLLLFEEKKRETFLTSKHASKLLKLETTFIFNYSNELYDHIAIKYLLIKAKEPEYFILYPSLLRITINLFPQLCQVQHYLYDTQASNVKNKNFNYFVDLIDNYKDSNNLPRNQFNKIKSFWFYGYSIHGSK